LCVQVSFSVEMHRLVSRLSPTAPALFVAQIRRGASAHSRPRPIPQVSTTFSDAQHMKLAIVDKTGVIANLLPEVVGCKPKYFVSRPRKFGKSFVLSTIAEIRKGNKAAFEGMNICKHAKFRKEEWTKHKVLHFDFSLLQATKTPEVFRTQLLEYVHPLYTSLHN